MTILKLLPIIIQYCKLFPDSGAILWILSILMQYFKVFLHFQSIPDSNAFLPF